MGKKLLTSIQCDFFDMLDRKGNGKRGEKSIFVENQIFRLSLFWRACFELILALIEYLVRKWFELHEPLNLYFWGSY